jgi:hypothetical protein
MKRLILLTSLVLAVAFMAGRDLRGSPTAYPGGLTVHEWGTFTSVAGAGGRAAKWVPRDTPQDLPCFVERYDWCVKCLPATVRMETPVLYFYSERPARVDVRVRFRQGAISEWFPHAKVTPSGRTQANLWTPGFESEIAWHDVRIEPNVSSALRDDGTRNHYYLARQTDASLLQVGSQQEKFLFYRGVGTFEPPLKATVDQAHVTLSSRAGGPLGDVILFENRGGVMGYEMRHLGSPTTTLARPALDDDEPGAPTKELASILEAHGLYPKEARAMVETWRDSWFEEGTRVFYIADRREVDRLLPLDISPAPSAVTRVFVGRLELMMPEREAALRSALHQGDLKAIKAFGRFFDPFASEILAATSGAERTRMAALMSVAYQPTPNNPSACR